MSHEVDDAKRRLLKAIATGSGVVVSRVVLPSLWVTPLVSAVALPAHAQVSCGMTDAANGVTTPTASQPLGGSLTITVNGNTLSVSVPRPSGILEYSLYEHAGAIAAGETTNVGWQLVSRFVPSNASASNVFTTTFTRAAGTYNYRLAWSGGCTAAQQVTVGGNP